MEELQMIVGTRTDLVCQVVIDEATLQVAKLMNVDVADIRECVCKEAFAESEAQSETEDEGAVLRVAKQLGNSEEDIRRYGLGDFSSESRIESVDRSEGATEAALTIASQFDNSEEDLKQYGTE